MKHTVADNSSQTYVTVHTRKTLETLKNKGFKRVQSNAHNPNSVKPKITGSYEDITSS